MAMRSEWVDLTVYCYLILILIAQVEICAKTILCANCTTLAYFISYNFDRYDTAPFSIPFSKLIQNSSLGIRCQKFSCEYDNLRTSPVRI